MTLGGGHGQRRLQPLFDDAIRRVAGMAEADRIELGPADAVSWITVSWFDRGERRPFEIVATDLDMVEGQAWLDAVGQSDDVATVTLALDEIMAVILQAAAALVIEVPRPFRRAEIFRRLVYVDGLVGLERHLATLKGKPYGRWRQVTLGGTRLLTARFNARRVSSTDRRRLVDIARRLVDSLGPEALREDARGKMRSAIASAYGPMSDEVGQFDGEQVTEAQRAPQIVRLGPDAIPPVADLQAAASRHDPIRLRQTTHPPATWAIAADREVGAYVRAVLGGQIRVGESA